MANIEEYLNALRQQKTQPLMQAYQKAKDTLANQQTELQQQQAQELPTYDTRKNQEDQAGWQQQQAMMRRAQATGNTTSGQLDTNMSMINNSVMNNKFGVDTQKQTFLQSMANKMNQVKQGMLQNDMEKDSNLAGLEGEIASKRYEMQQQQEAAARAASRGGGSKGMSATQEKANASADALEWMQNLINSGYSPSEISNAMNDNMSEFVRAGVNMKLLTDNLMPMYNSFRFRSGGRAAQ